MMETGVWVGHNTVLMTKHWSVRYQIISEALVLHTYERVVHLIIYAEVQLFFV